MAREAYSLADLMIREDPGVVHDADLMRVLGWLSIFGSSGFRVGPKILSFALGLRERVNGAGIELEERPLVVGTIWGCKIELSMRGCWGSKIHGE
jgi:hypothetical protein